MNKLAGVVVVKDLTDNLCHLTFFVSFNVIINI